MYMNTSPPSKQRVEYGDAIEQGKANAAAAAEARPGLSDIIPRPQIDFPIVGVGAGLIGFGIANRITRDFTVSALSAVLLGAAAEYKKRSIPIIGRFLR
jgi:hypothetical protein